MHTLKSEVLEMIQAMPDDLTYEDLMKALYIRQQIQKSLDQIETGEILTHEEVKDRISKWIL